MSFFVLQNTPYEVSLQLEIYKFILTVLHKQQNNCHVYNTIFFTCYAVINSFFYYRLCKMPPYNYSTYVMSLIGHSLLQVRLQIKMFSSTFFLKYQNIFNLMNNFQKLIEYLQQRQFKKKKITKTILNFIVIHICTFTVLGLSTLLYWHCTRHNVVLCRLYTKFIRCRMCTD